jgi:hypothetical protein
LYSSIIITKWGTISQTIAKITDNHALDKKKETLKMTNSKMTLPVIHQTVSAIHNVVIVHNFSSISV